jgi:HlyD family secretion protein
MRRRRVLIGIGIVLVVLVIVVINLKSAGKGIEVDVAGVDRGEIIAVVTAPGRVKPTTHVKLSSDIMGRIVVLEVAEGDWVKAGQVVAVLDNTRQRASLERAKSAVESAKVNLNYQKMVWERTTKLYEQGLVSKEQYEAARVELTNAQAALVQARAALSQADDELSKTEIITPISGVVTDLNVEQGEIVVTGTMNNPGTVLMTISDLARMEVECEVDETDVVDIKIGQEARIELDALPDTTLQGSVSEIANTGQVLGMRTEDEVTNFMVGVVLSDPLLSIRPEMSATVEIITATRSDALSIPIQCVVMRPPPQKDEEEGASDSDGEGSEEVSAEPIEGSEEGEEEVEVVFVVRDGDVMVTPVETGISSETHVEIVSGLNEGDTVVTGPYRIFRELSDGDRVKVSTPQGQRGGEGRRGSADRD